MSKYDHVKCLTIVPAGDGNFLASLKAASVSELHDASVLTWGKKGDGSRFKAIAAEIKRREKAGDGLGQIKNQESGIKNESAPLEVFSKDDPVGSLGRALEKLGKSVTDEMIVTAWGAAQAAQEDFSLKRIRLGLYLWSVREVVKVRKGAWMKYLRHIAKILGLADGEKSTRIYDLVAYAQRLVMVVAQGSTKSDTLRLRMESLAEAERTSLIALDLDSPAGQAALAKMVGKSSLRELIRDLNESAKAADEMAEAEAKASKAEEGKQGGGEEESQPPAPPETPEQTDFFADLFAAPIAQIKTVYEAHCGSMTDDAVLQTEAALLATLEVVQIRADDVRKRQAAADQAAKVSKRKLLSGAE